VPVVRTGRGAPRQRVAQRVAQPLSAVAAGTAAGLVD